MRSEAGGAGPDTSASAATLISRYPAPQAFRFENCWEAYRERLLGAQIHVHGGDSHGHALQALQRDHSDDGERKRQQRREHRGDAGSATKHLHSFISHRLCHYRQTAQP